MNVYISVDIEGITGTVSFSQCGRPDGQHYDFGFARRMLTHDVNAAIRGARAGGATRVVVKDSHATCKNLLIDELEPGTELISGFGSGNDGMMEGIDESFDAAFLVGYHAMCGALNGMMEHALVGGLHRFRVNGVLAGEMLVSGAIAGAYGVPLALVTSDQAGCDEATAALPGVVAYATKFGFGRFMGRLLHPSETGPGIEAAAKKAVHAAKTIKPLALDRPVTMSAEFHKVEEADLAALLPYVKRLDAYTLQFSAATFLEANRMAEAVFKLSIQGRRSDS